jgi:nucleotide-binding universal stress UspA family protein
VAFAPALAKPSFAFKSILFATDFSSASDSAAAVVHSLASMYGSTVYAVHVLPNNHTADWDESAWHWQFARANLQSFLENHNLRQLPHKVLIGTGNVAQRLAAFQRDISPDLVVLGTHGRTGVNKFFLGSIAERLFRTSSCPVLTVGPRVVPRTDRWQKFDNIVVATDFTESSVQGLRYAHAIAAQHSGRLIVLHAVDEIGLAIASYIDEVLPRAELRVRKWVNANLPDLSVVTLSAARFGHAADVILQAAALRHADLIVMSAHGSEFPAMAAHAPIDTAYTVVASANCPVLTVRASTK